MSSLSQFAGGSIKSIQRGVIAVPSGNYSSTAAISAVNTAKSELRLLGIDGYSNGWGTAGVWPGKLSLTNSTTITASSSSFAAAGAVNVSWELTEWD